MLIQAAISALITLLDKGDIFDRITHQIDKINKNYPNTPGASKKDLLVKELEIIGIETGRAITNLLIELGVTYLKAQFPASSAVADKVESVIQDKIDNAVDSLENIQS